jgi:hypothetical protein
VKEPYARAGQEREEGRAVFQPQNLNPKQDKKAKKDEECRSLQRQLKGEIEKNKTLQAPKLN